MTDDIDPQAGRVQMHTGCCLFWEQNAAGGRTYHSDEIAGGVLVWDTCLVDFSTLCEAFSIEMALQSIERRASIRREQARRAALRRNARMPDGSLPSNSSAPPPDAGLEVYDGRRSLGPVVRPADDGPCPNCGALGCWTPCPHEPPLPDQIPEGVAVFDGDTLPDELRAGYVRADFPGLVRAAQGREQPLTHSDITLRVALRRARNQLLRYSSEDPVAAEITKLLDEGPAK